MYIFITHKFYIFYEDAYMCAEKYMRIAQRIDEIRF